MSGNSLYLASASPRRRELLRQIGIEAQVCHAAIDETPLPGECVQGMAERLALAKAMAVAGQLQTELAQECRYNSWVLGADTAGIIGNEMLLKPLSKLDAFRMWRLMSHGTHQVITAIALVNVANPDIRYQASSLSDVTFGEISETEMEHYWNSGEPQDKAGAYAIQGYAACWVKKFTGSYSGIVGLPLYEFRELLHRSGIHTIQ